MNTPTTPLMEKGFKKKLGLFSGYLLCTIGAALLIPLFREIQYQDRADVSALGLMIVAAFVVGVTTVFLSKKEIKIFLRAA